MLPVSSRDLIRFTPSEFSPEARAKAEAADEDTARFDAAPVYLLAVPTVMGRAAWRRDVAAAGARYWPDDVMIEALRDGVRSVVEADQQAELLDIVDRFEAERAGAPDDADGAARGALRHEMAQIERAVRAHDPRYAALEADRVFWLAVAPIKAAQHFLRGWENLAAPFERRAGFVAEAALAAVPEAHLVEIGFKAMSLMAPGKAREKNFASPSRSG